MTLNKQKGNMYEFVTHTWNTVKGKCPHACSYCYMKRWGEQPELHFDESELKTDLGEGNFIFVGSSCDMWAEKINSEWIDKTLSHCKKHPHNRYLFQSKNPWRFHCLRSEFKRTFTLGTTIESNWDVIEAHSGSILSGQPSIQSRIEGITCIRENGYPVMITIEPIMRFNLRTLSEMIAGIQPQWVNIGADSGGHKLPEPPYEKVKELISELEKFTTVKLKKNLRRLAREFPNG